MKDKNCVFYNPPPSHVSVNTVLILFTFVSLHLQTFSRPLYYANQSILYLIVSLISPILLLLLSNCCFLSSSFLFLPHVIFLLIIFFFFFTLLKPTKKEGKFNFHLLLLFLINISCCYFAITYLKCE